MPSKSDIFEDFSDEENKFFEQGDANEPAADAGADGVRDQQLEPGDAGSPGAEGAKENGAPAEGAGEKKEPEDARKEEEKPEVSKVEEERENYRRARDEERNKRRQLEQQVAEMRTQMQSFASLRAELEALRKPPEKPDDDFDTDPVGALKREVDAIKAKDKEGEKQQEEMTAAQREFADFQKRVRDATVEFQQDHPDYTDALNHLLQARVQELSVFGLPEDQIAQTLTQEAINIARFAEQNTKNPAQVVYDMAKLRGYTGKKAPEQKTEQKKADDLQGKLDKIEQGQREAQTLSGAGGGKKNAGSLSLSDIEKMPDEDFDKLWKEMERTAYGTH